MLQELFKYIGQLRTGAEERGVENKSPKNNSTWINMTPM